MRNQQDSLPLRLAKGIASVFPKATLNMNELLEQAVEQAGLSDYGDMYFLKGFEVLLDSAKNDAQLNPIGLLMLKMAIQGMFENRLRMIQSRKDNLPQATLAPPIFVTGLFRSGTTFLHLLLAEDPNHTGIPMWELMYPFSPNPDKARRTCSMQMELRKVMLPEIDSIHRTLATNPEECIVFQAITGISPGYWNGFPVYGHLEWLKGQNSLKFYEEYLYFLRLYQSRFPYQRLVLKSPVHMNDLHSLTKVFPNAKIVMMHRDPVRASTSYCSMNFPNYRMAADNIDLRRIGTASVEYLAGTARNCMEWRAENPGRIFDVDYEQLRTSPVNVVRGIYDHFGIPWSDDLERRLNRYVQANPQGKYGPHYYSPEEFSLNPDWIRKMFADYREVHSV